MQRENKRKEVQEELKNTQLFTKNGNKDSDKRVITIDVKDNKMNKIQEFKLTLSKHSSERINERNISNEALSIALIYGEVFFKQGLIFYVLGNKNLPALLDKKLQRKCQNLVVVVAGDSDEIITTYKSKNPYKHIKKKTKRLSRWGNAA
jgi:hypothetical protein|tara:strand:+ start:4406 stop:4852 length:447 start_codon:yes stop_codon:yes gene_type:complete